jgi:hypothetical protein
MNIEIIEYNATSSTGETTQAIYFVPGIFYIFIYSIMLMLILITALYYKIRNG